MQGRGSHRLGKFPGPLSGTAQEAGICRKCFEPSAGTARFSRSRACGLALLECRGCFSGD